MFRRIGVIMLAVLLAFGLSRITAGSAASLPLDAYGSPVFVTGEQRCASGPLTVAPSGTPSGGQYAQVTVSGITGSCSAGGVAVILSASPHTVLFSGTGSVTGNSFTATSAAFTPPASANGIALVSLDGWIVPATWTYTPPTTTTTTSTTTTSTTTTTTVPPTTTTTTTTTTSTTSTTTTTTTTLPPTGGALSCKPVNPAVTATCAVEVDSWNVWEGGYRVGLRMTTTSSTPFQWEVRIDLSKQATPPNNRVSNGFALFPGVPVPPYNATPAWTPSLFQGENFCRVSTVAELPVMRIRGVSWNQNVSSGAPAGSVGIQTQRTSGSPWSSFPAC